VAAVAVTVTETLALVVLVEAVHAMVVELVETSVQPLTVLKVLTVKMVAV
jgi:hypothetical protein